MDVHLTYTEYKNHMHFDCYCYFVVTIFSSQNEDSAAKEFVRAVETAENDYQVCVDCIHMGSRVTPGWVIMLVVE